MFRDAWRKSAADFTHGLFAFFLCEFSAFRAISPARAALQPRLDVDDDDIFGRWGRKYLDNRESIVIRILRLIDTNLRFRNRYYDNFIIIMLWSFRPCNYSLDKKCSRG